MICCRQTSSDRSGKARAMVALIGACRFEAKSIQHLRHRDLRAQTI
jgi:hypothetical protein